MILRELPKRSNTELAAALRARADLISGELWEVPATAAMMREAADALLAAEQRALREAARAFEQFSISQKYTVIVEKWLRARSDSFSSPIRDGETKQP